MTTNFTKQEADPAVTALLDALGLLPSKWRRAAKALLDHFDPEAQMPTGTVMMRDAEGNLVEVDCAQRRYDALLQRAMDKAQDRMSRAYLERAHAYLVAPYIDEDLHLALNQAALQQAWLQSFQELPSWVQRLAGSAAAANPFERAKRNLGPLSREDEHQSEVIREITREHRAEQASLGRSITELEGLDPARRRLVGRHLEAQAKTARLAVKR